MGNFIKNWAKRQKVGDRNAKGILLEIADCASDDTGYMWYAEKTIAETLEMSVKTVERGLAYLIEKKFICRSDREKVKGKFSSKGTQILISENDWQDIRAKQAIARAKQSQPSDKLTDGEEKPQDNLSDGDTEPTDKLSDGGEKPQDKLTDGEENQPSICPKPAVNLSDGQFVSLTLNKEELIFEPEEETENTNTVRAREGPHSFGDFRLFCLAGMAKELNVKDFPQKKDWTETLKWAFAENFTFYEVIECFKLLNAQHWRTSPVSPSALENNLPNLKKLRKEKPNGKSNGKPKSKSTDSLSDEEWAKQNAHLIPAE